MLFRCNLLSRHHVELTSVIFTAIAPVHCVAQEYKCTPNVKYECTAERCDSISSEFAHAESFSYDLKTRIFTACLWTNCYSGRPIVLIDKKLSAFTLSGRLRPAHSGNDPMTVTMTVVSNTKFIATWDLNGDSLTIDMGTCVRVR